MNTVGTLPYCGTVGTYGRYRTYGRYKYCDTAAKLLPGKGKERGKMLARTDKEA